MRSETPLASTVPGFVTVSVQVRRSPSGTGSGFTTITSPSSTIGRVVVVVLVEVVVLVVPPNVVVVASVVVVLATVVEEVVGVVDVVVAGTVVVVLVVVVVVVDVVALVDVVVTGVVVEVVSVVEVVVAGTTVVVVVVGGVNLQSGSQPSPGTALPSSHSSPPPVSMMPSPQRDSTASNRRLNLWAFSVPLKRVHPSMILPSSLTFPASRLHVSHLAWTSVTPLRWPRSDFGVTGPHSSSMATRVPTCSPPVVGGFSPATSGSPTIRYRPDGHGCGFGPLADARTGSRLPVRSAVASKTRTAVPIDRRVEGTVELLRCQPRSARNAATCASCTPRGV